MVMTDGLVHVTDSRDGPSLKKIKMKKGPMNMKWIKRNGPDTRAMHPISVPGQPRGDAFHVDPGDVY